MRSVLLVSSVCCAFSHASSTCNSKTELDHDGNSLLQAKSSVRKHVQRQDAKTLLLSMQDVASSFTKDAVASMTPAEVNAAIGTANTALQTMLPMIEQQHALAQQEIENALAAVQGCHDEHGEVRARIEQSVASAHHAFEVCEESLSNAIAAEHETCEGQEDDPNCLCDEARVAVTDQTALCASMMETFEAVYCELHGRCTMFHECHARETEIYVAARINIEAAMVSRQDEYRTFMQVDCLMNLITTAMLSGTPIDAASYLACDDVNVDHLAIIFPHPPGAPAGCPRQRSGDPQCETHPHVDTEWHLVIKSNGDTTLGFSSPYWTDSVLLNEQSPIAEAGNAKYPAFNDVPVTQIRLCIDSPEDNCFEHTLPAPQASARSLFSAGYIEDRTFDKEDLLRVLGESPGKECAMEKPGFNTVCPQNNAARFGFCNNVPDQPCQDSSAPRDSDAALGIGLKGQSSREVGAGWTHYGINRQQGAVGKNMWLWVKQMDSTSHAVMVDGCENQNTEVSREVVHISEARTASVRCCNDAGDHCDTSELQGGCQEGKTYEEAVQVCADNSQRLCTESEITNRVCCGTGCNFDGHQIWVAALAMPQVHAGARGDQQCDTASVNSEECLASAQAVLTAGSVRAELIEGSWSHVPPGCSTTGCSTFGCESLYPGSSEFAAHYNSNPSGVNDGGFAMICSR